MTTKNDVLNIDFLNQLDFSDVAQQIATLKSSLFEYSEQQQLLKIQLIQEAIAAGQYEVNPTMITQRLLEQLLVEEVACA